MPDARICEMGSSSHSITNPDRRMPPHIPMVWPTMLAVLLSFWTLTSASAQDVVVDTHANRPDVAALAGGGYVSVFHGSDNSGYGVFASVDGGPRIPINTTTTNEQLYPYVVGLDTGQFAVVFFHVASQSAGVYQARYRVMNADATSLLLDSHPMPNDLEVSPVTATKGHWIPIIASLPGGRFVVVWKDATEPHALDMEELRGRVFDNQGNGGPEFGISSGGYTHVPNQIPAIAATRDGFFATWQHQTSSGPELIGRHFDLAPGSMTPTPSAPQFAMASPLASGERTTPSLASWRDGVALVYFEGNAAPFDVRTNFYRQSDLTALNAPYAPSHSAGTANNTCGLGPDISVGSGNGARVVWPDNLDCAISPHDAQPNAQAMTRLVRDTGPLGQNPVAIVPSGSTGPQHPPRISSLDCGYVVTWRESASPAIGDSHLNGSGDIYVRTLLPANCTQSPPACPDSPADLAFLARFNTGVTEPDVVGGLVPVAPTNPHVLATQSTINGVQQDVLHLNSRNARLRFAGGNNSVFGFGNNDFTIAAWIQLQPNAANALSVSLLDLRSPDQNTLRGVSLFAMSGRFGAHLSNGTQRYSWVTSHQIADGNWHHVAVSVDRNGTSSGLYVDGVRVDDVPSGLAGLFDHHSSQYPTQLPLPAQFDPGILSGGLGNRNPLFIGHDQDSSFDGQARMHADDVAVFHRALDTTEIATLFQGLSCP